MEEINLEDKLTNERNGTMEKDFELKTNGVMPDENNMLNNNNNECRENKGENKKDQLLETTNSVDDGLEINKLENEDNITEHVNGAQDNVINIGPRKESLRNSSCKNDNRKLSSDKHVRFAENDKKLDVNSKIDEDDLGLLSAESRETKVVWEMISEGQKEAVKVPHKRSSDSTDSVFDNVQYDPWQGKVTDLDEEETNGVLKGENVFRSLLEERKNQKVSVSDYFAAGGYLGGGAPPTHTCGSLFAQCGAHRQQSLVTTFSHGRYRQDHADDSYSGPVSLTEILQERETRQDTERMCRLREIDDELNRLELSLMGNGASTTGKSEKNGHGLCSSNPFVDCNKGVESTGAGVGVVSQLKKEIKQWEEKTSDLGDEVAALRKDVKRKDHEILRLQREVHKLKSVLQQASSFRPDSDLLSSLHGQSSGTAHKKQGVSAESSQPSQTATDIQIQRYEKDFRSKQVIKEAIMDNDFLKNLDLSQVRELVESMYPKEYTKGSYLIREGEVGAHLFVSAEGEFEVIKENKVLGRMGPGKAFGELAILYNCTRTASIRVVRDSKVWVLDRRVFQRIMMRTGLQRLEDNVNFLRSVPLLHNLSSDVLGKISDVLEVEFYPTGHHIIRQGASGDTFFILSQGSVKVTQRLTGSSEEQDLRVLHRGDYFGEQALLKEDCRTASVIALAPGVECLTLDRESFIQLIGDLSELHEKEYSDLARTERPPSSNSLPSEVDQDLEHIQLEDVDVVSTLGVGGFGRVELVQCLHDKSKTYALKCLKKQHIVETHQQEHVYSEKEIMMSCRHPFICRLYKTFKDSKYVYMMLEACLGGEVWTILRDRGCFDDSSACFITACVIEALDYLHSRGIVYRDLKPENLLLDSRGYVKLVDFGFAKRLGLNSSKTWTFCGTPEYVAPEIILNKGHDRAVDCWALGILMHELLTGAPPFSGSDPMKIYNMILKGIDMVDFPRHVTRTAQALIKKLCRDTPAERLGCQKGGLADIKKNKWFQGFDWDGLRHQTLVPPIVPQIRSPIDTSNFDHYAKDTQVPYDEDSNWDADF